MKIHELIRKSHSYYDGDLPTIYRDFVSARVAPTVRRENEGKPQSETGLIPQYEFYWQNVVRLIIDMRVDFMPNTFDISAMPAGSDREDEAITSELRDWLDDNNFNHRTFWEELNGYYRTQEKAGTVYLKLYLKDGKATVRKWNSRYVSVETDPVDVQEVVRYVFEVSRGEPTPDGGSTTATYREEIDGKEIVTKKDGAETKREAHGWPFIPVVRIVREADDDSPYGIPAVPELVPAQQDVNMALTKRAMTTKYNTFKVWSPRNEDPNRKVAGPVRIAPGAVAPFPIDAVGGDINLSAVEKELDDALEYLYNLGKVPRPQKDRSLGVTSGEAILKMTEPLRKLVATKQAYCREAFEDLLKKAWHIMHGQEIDVSVKFPSLDVEDKDYQLKLAQFLADRGYDKEAVLVLGYDESYYDTMEKDKKDREERAALEYDAERNKDLGGTGTGDENG